MDIADLVKNRWPIFQMGSHPLVAFSLKLDVAGIRGWRVVKVCRLRIEGDLSGAERR